MDLGSKIAAIRKNNKMSQEEFAEIFNVSRQTISNWENSKSYPDIKTLVKMSDIFDVSLDVLLKEDKLMIEKIDKDIKNTRIYKRILISVIAVFAVTVLAFGIFFAIYSVKYNNVKNELETKFAAAVEENSFEKVDGVYILKTDDNVVYEAPNQKMPSKWDFKLHFYATFLHAYIDRGDIMIEIVWNDYDSYAVYETERDFPNTIIGDHAVYNSNKEALDLEKLSDELKVDKELLKNTIDRGNEYYNDFYR